MAQLHKSRRSRRTESVTASVGTSLLHDLDGSVARRFESIEDVTVHEHKGANGKTMKAYVGNMLGAMLLICSISACDTQMSRSVAIDEPDPDLYFVRGYRSESDPCKLTGETEFTNKFLDDAADLVTCLTAYRGTKDFIELTGAKILTHTQSYTLYSVPRR